MISSFLHHPQQGDRRGQDDQQTPRPGRGLADEGFDRRSVVEVCRHLASLRASRAEGLTGGRRARSAAGTIRLRRRHGRRCAAIGRATCAVTLNHVSHDAPPASWTAARSSTARQVLVGALGDPRHRRDRACRRDRAGLGPAGQGLDESVRGQLVVADRVGAGGGRVDAQLRPDPAHPAEIRRACTSSKLRSEAAFYAANSLSTTLPGGPVLSATFLLRQQRIWGASTVVASWQLVMSGVLQAVGLALLGLGGAFFLGAKNNPFSLLFTLGGFVALAAAGPGGGVAPGADRRHRQPGVGVGQLDSRQAGRHRPGQVARDAHAARIGEPGPPRPGGGVQLVAVQLDRRRRLPRLRRVRGRRPRVGRRVDGCLCGRSRGRHDTADAGRAAGRRGGAGARPGLQWDVVAERHLGDADLPADQLATHRRRRLGGVLLRVPHREHRRLRRR